MRICLVCGHQNPEEAQFCLKCAASLGLACPTCGQPVPAGSRFCNQCGTRLPESVPSPSATPRQAERQPGQQVLMPTSLVDKIKAASTEISGERREITVLFVDIANFTATAHALDSEEVYLLTDEAMRLWADVIYHYEGTIDKFTGDGLLALFGLPLTHENDPERAIRAALDMQQALQPLRLRLKQTHNLELRTRIGIHTGPVIAGRMGSDLHMEYTVIGDTVNLAARLQAMAEPDSIAVSFATYQRTRPLFRYKPLPPFIAKGKPAPIRAFCPLGLRARPGQVRGLPGMQVPMIGRADALDQLQDTLAEVLRHARSRIALVTGEPGVGKSRLVAEFRRAISHAEVSFYQGSCMTYTRSRPLWLLANVLRDMVHLSETDPASLQYEALQAYLNQLGLNQDGILACLLHVLGLTQMDLAATASLQHLDHAVLQKLTYAALREVFLAESRLTPCVLVFDDLHWVDAASRDFLEHLIQSVDHAPLLLILVSRDAERASVLSPLLSAADRRHDRLVDIHLKPLSAGEGQLLVSRFIAQSSELADTLKRRIAERAEGNPFYAEEIIRMLIEQEGLVGDQGNWQVTPAALDMVEAVPGTLNGLILARFDRLPEDLRRTLQKAAVLGSLFPTQLLCSLNDASPEVLAQRLSLLEAQQFLTVSPFGLEDGYAFRHALIQEVVYSTLLKRDRQQLHAKAAQAIEQGGLWAADELAETVAYHYLESATPARAIPHLMLAGESAARRCAYETAIQHYQQALALMQEQPADYGNQLVRVQVGLGQALKFVGKYTQAAHVLEEAFQNLLRQSLKVDTVSLLPVLVKGFAELADIRVREGASEEAVTHLQAGLDALGDQGAQTHPRLWRALIDRLAWVRFRQGKLDDAFTLASSATLGLDAAKGDDPATLASLYNTLGGVFWQWGNLSEAAAYVERSLEAYQSLNYAWGMAIAYTNLGILHYAQGLWPQAADYFERAYVLRRENGYLPEQAVSLNNLGLLRLAMGDHAQAQQDLEASLSISQRLGDDFGVMYAQVGLGHLAVIQSRFEEAASHIEAALSLSDSAEDQAIQARWLWALIQAARGDLLAGLESAEQGLHMARKAGLLEPEADCRRVLGSLHARAGNDLEAESLLHEAMDLYLQLNTPYGQALTLLELGYLYQRRASAPDPTSREWRAKGLTAFDAAAEQFETLGAVYDLHRAQAALSQLHAQVAVEPAPPSYLVSQAEPTTPAGHPGLPEGEWHTAAVVWLQLSAPPDMDEEAVFEIMALAIPALTVIAQEYQGRVIRRPDGLTVIFGAPTAYEDDAERAVQTAWELARYLQEPTEHGTAPLIGHLAVSYGEVVAGRLGSQVHAEFVVRGEPVQQAQRLAQLVPSGKVWVTEAVRAVTQRLFVYAPPAEVPADLAGLAPLELVSVRQQPGPARGLVGLKTRLIGREKPLRSMQELTRHLSRGIGGLIWIEGEPGIGKSRLMREFVASIPDSAPWVWQGRCLPQRSGQAFSLFSDLLTQALGLQPTDTPEQVRARIQQVIHTWPRDAHMTRPYLETLLGVQPGGLEGKRLNSLEPEQLRQQIFVALRRLFKSLTSQQPIILLLDDLHWIDPMSAELLQFLLPMVTSVPILFVCAQRRQGADSPNDRLVRIQSLIPTQTVRLSLERLSVTETEALLDELLPQIELPARLRSVILERSDGNPYFVEEYVRVLIDQGYVQHHQGRWSIAPGQDLEDLPLPSSLETLIRSRVDALPSELKQLMQYAAVIGSSFETSLIQDVCGQPDVSRALGRLESRLLIHSGAESGRWEFNHSLIESVVYNSMLKAQRRAIHLQVARVMETRWAGAEAEHAEELAYHYTQAGEGGKALIYLVLAGERAAARFANEEARTYFEQANQQLGLRPETDVSLHWRVATGLGDVYRAMGQYPQSKAILEHGLALVEAHGLPDEWRAGLHRRLGATAQKQGDLEAAYEHCGQALSILGELTESQAQAEIARVLNDLAWIHFMRGHFDQSRTACEASLTYARGVNALSELATAENTLGGIYYHQGDWKAALHHTTRAMILREQMGYTWGVASTLSNLGILAVSAGHWSKARSFFERSLTLRQEIGDVEGIAIAHHNLGTLARDQGELELAEAHFRQSLAVAGPFKMAFHIASAQLGLAQVLVWQGEVEAALAATTHSLEQAEAIGAQDLLAEVYRIQAEIWLAQSSWDEARSAAEQSAALATSIGNRSLEAAAWRVFSEIELRCGDVPAARGALARAQRALAHAHDELEAGRVAAQAGRIALQEGQPGTAEAELRIAQEIFMRLGASRDLKGVEQALAAPASPVRLED